MSIVKMKRLRLLGMRSDRDPLFRLLQKQGCVEINEPAIDPDDPDWAALVRPDGRGLASVREQNTLLNNALSTLKKYSSAKDGLFSKRPTLSEKEFFDDDTYVSGLETARAILDCERGISQMTAEQAKLQSQKAALAPWIPLDVPLELEGDKSISLVFGTIPAKADYAGMTAAVAAANEMSELFHASTDSDLQYFLLLCHVSAEDACVEAMRPFGFSRANVRGWTGTAAENDRMLDGQIAELDEKLAAAKEHIASFAPQRNDLRRCVDRSVQDIAREEAATRLVDTDSTFYLQGWIPAEAEEQLAGILNGFTCAWETEVPAPEEYQEVPIKLKSNKLTAPYNVITEMYSLPAYNGLDPNPFIMPFFALFFGIMFADMAYGLLMAVAGILALKLMKPKGTMKNMMGLLIQCGISTFIIGFLTGGFFGDAVSVVAGIFGKEASLVPYLGTIHIGSSIAIDLPLNLLEGNNPLYVLILALCLGVIHLAFGVGIGVYLNAKDGNWLDIAADLSWWVMFVGIAVMVLAGTPIVLYIGIAIMVVATFLKGKGIGRITGLFGAVYNGVTGYLGDILSYSRLMALMLAGSVIASVFNQLGALGGLLLFIPVALIGHVLNFALNLIGCFVHTMRLQFLEFFGKWYRDGGRPFRPLNYNTKYVDIKED